MYRGPLCYLVHMVWLSSQLLYMARAAISIVHTRKLTYAYATLRMLAHATWGRVGARVERCSCLHKRQGQCAGTCNVGPSSRSRHFDHASSAKADVLARATCGRATGRSHVRLRALGADAYEAHAPRPWLCLLVWICVMWQSTLTHSKLICLACIAWLT